jgi:hypothetical protein
MNDFKRMGGSLRVIRFNDGMNLGILSASDMKPTKNILKARSTIWEGDSGAFHSIQYVRHAVRMACDEYAPKPAFAFDPIGSTAPNGLCNCSRYSIGYIDYHYNVFA